MILKTEAIVLRTIDFHETSRIAIFYSKNYGKLKGILKGIRKDPKKFGSHVDRFSVNDIVYYHYRHSDLHLISQCDLRQYFFPIRQDIRRTLAAMYMLELVDKIMPLEESNFDVYQLMIDFLTTLETTTAMNKVICLFQIKILSLSGFQPYLDACLVCNKKITGKARFSMKEGGLICLTCSLQDPYVTLISQGTIASLLHVENHPWERCLRLGFAPTVQKELKYILNNFLMFHLGQPLKSAKFVAS